jgi:hypothetical protein
MSNIEFIKKKHFINQETQLVSLNSETLHHHELDIIEARFSTRPFPFHDLQRIFPAIERLIPIHPMLSI